MVPLILYTFRISTSPSIEKQTLQKPNENALVQADFTDNVYIRILIAFAEDYGLCP